MNPGLSEKIKDNLTMKQVAEFYLGDAKRGAWLCPFHSDQKPSMTVKGGKFKCWSCNESGDVFDFVGKMNGLDFQGAVSLLARDFGYSDKELSRADKIAYTERKKALKAERDRVERIARIERDKIDLLCHKRRVLYYLTRCRWKKWTEAECIVKLQNEIKILELELDDIVDNR